MEYKVRVKHVSKAYSTIKNNKKLWNMILPGKDKTNEYYMALKDISFDVLPGDSVGIVGLNGSGKSTLSNLLGGVSEPSSGTIEVNGKASLIAISAGLNMELTGRENIHMKCLMHGLSEKQISERYDQIVEFSELEDFMHQPIKSYSSGMQSRLGFAIAVHTDPDVLIVDEALSVGDDTFTNKCIRQIEAFRQEGKTIFFVSHSIPQIQKMCNKALWLHYGEVRDYGDAVPVVGMYARFIRGYNQKEKHVQKRYKKEMLERQRTTDFKYMNDHQRFGVLNGVILGGVTLSLCIAAYFQIMSHF